MWKYLDLFLELLFSHIIMSAKFELLLLSICTVKIHAWCIMLRFVIFVLDAIFHIWSSSLDILLDRMRTVKISYAVLVTLNLNQICKLISSLMYKSLIW